MKKLAIFMVTTGVLIVLAGCGSPKTAKALTTDKCTAGMRGFVDQVIINDVPTEQYVCSLVDGRTVPLSGQPPEQTGESARVTVDYCTKPVAEDGLAGKIVTITRDSVTAVVLGPKDEDLGPPVMEWSECIVGKGDDALVNNRVLVVEGPVPPDTPREPRSMTSAMCTNDHNGRVMSGEIMSRFSVCESQDLISWPWVSD